MMKTTIQKVVLRAVAVFLPVLVIVAAHTALAADWTDADGNEYTALKAIKGNASGYVVTDITPTSTDVVKMRFKLAATSGNSTFFCARSGLSDMFSCMRTVASRKCTIRLDRENKNGYVSDTYDTSTEYLLDANFDTKEVRLNGNASTVSNWTTDSYTVGSVLYFFALHSNGTLTANYYGNDYLYYFELYDSTTGKLKCCLLPAQCASGENEGKYGLFDTKTGTFYPQSGGTAFVTANQTVRTVTAPSGCKKWIGRGADNKMSTDANWEGGLPQAGDDLDFTLAPPLAEINADISGVTFGKLWIDDGDIPTFTGSMSVSDCNNRAKVAGNTSVVFPAGNYTWRGTETNWGDADAWTFDNAAATWADGNNAIFSTANATATLAANVAANSLAFNANATIGGASTLTVPTVSVASGVSATISAPTDGALTKTGAGTLTLGSSRSAATTLAEGTLALSGTASLNWSSFTLGTDSAKPVTLDFGETATLASVPATWYIGNIAGITSTVVKNGGAWTASTAVRVGSAAGTASFYHKGGSLTTARLMVGDDNTTGHAGTGYAEISGGTVTSTGTSNLPIIGCYSDGTVVVTNSGRFVCNGSLYVGYTESATGILTVVDGGIASIAKNICICGGQATATGILNIKSGGTLSSETVYREKSGGATVNFDGGTFKKASGTGNIFPAEDNASAVAVTVSANGGTLDNNTFAVALPCTITGAGGMTLSGSGTTTISANQSYLGTTTVSNETTLSVSGGVTFAGPVVFNEDSALDIAGYNGTTPLSATAITFPDEGTVALTLDSGAFDTGVYKICAADDLTAADGEKFSIDTGDKSHMWSMHDNTLILLVGEVDANAWTGLAGDGKMSSAANWAGYAVPAAGEDIDLSGISADTTIIADANRTFGAVTMGSGVVTFTNSFAATSFSDTSKVAVGADSIVTIEGDLVFGSNVTACVCYSIAAGGMFAVTGDIIATAEHTGYVVPCIGQYSIPGTISCKGIVNNCGGTGDRFYLVRDTSDSLANWLVGEDGISGSKRFRIDNNNNSHANISARTNFTVSADIVQHRNLTLDTAGYTITLGTSTLARSGGILGGAANGLTTVTGTGKVVVDYNVNDLFSSASSRTNVFSVATGATLTLNPGANIGFGTLTVQGGATLEIQSGTTTFGNLTVAENAILGFNFTDRRNAPVLALYDGAEVNAPDPFTVKVSGTVWPSGGEKLLTTCGGFDGIPLTLSATGNAARWANQDRLSVNADGNIVLDVKPMGTLILFR